MKWVVIVLGSLAGLVLLAAGIGWALPEDHVAAKTLGCGVRRRKCWAAIADYMMWPLQTGAAQACPCAKAVG